MPVVAGSGYQNSLSEVRLKVRNRLMQTSASNSTWTDAMIDDYINDTLKEMLLDGLIEIAQDTFTTTADQQTWVPAATVWKIVEINYNDDCLREMTRDDMNHLTDGDWDSQSGDWTAWFMEETQNDRKVRFDKKAPTGKTVNFWFWRCPEDITDDDELTGMFHVFTPIIVEGALWKAHEADGNGDEAQQHKGNFRELIPKAQLHVDKLHESDAASIRDHVGSCF